MVKGFEGIDDKELRNKSDEIIVQIIDLNELMEKDLSFSEYEAIFEQLNAIRHVLTEEQIIKLDKLIKKIDK